MFKRMTLLASLGLVVLTLGTGCSDKVTEQRDTLLKQNEELTAQLNAEKAAHADADARANAVPAAPAATNPGTPSMESSDSVLPPAGPVASSSTDFVRGKNKHNQDVIVLSSDLLFDSGKATLKPAAKKALDKVAGIIKKEYANQTLRIEGYTDPTPIKHATWDDNWDLGAARARSVLLYLIEKGVPKKNMYIASFADTELKSTKNLALDRRVEIVVTNSGK